MKYTKQKRSDIGRAIYNQELTTHQAAEKYQINYYTARDYLRQYKAKNDLQPQECSGESQERKKNKPQRAKDFEELKSLTRDELIDEVIKARVEAECAKKGYVVKGGCQEKDFINLCNLNSK